MEKSRDEDDLPQGEDGLATVRPVELEEVTDTELKSVSGGLDGSSKDAAY